MSTTTTHTLTLKRLIRADREAVFRALTVPEEMARWSAPEGMTLSRVEVDLKVGGRFRLRMHEAEGATFNAFGTYLEIDPPRRLRYTWSWEEPEHDVGETVITIELHDRDGATELTMVHELFPSAEAMAEHEQGWTSCLDRLEALLAG